MNDEIKKFQQRLDALHRYLKIDAKINLVSHEELKTQQNDFWNDAKSAELIMKKIKKDISILKKEYN